MVFNKILGYLLLAAGLALIIFALFQSYNIFTGNSQAPLVFKTINFQPQKSEESNSSSDDQKQINQEISKQISQIIPADTLPKVLNLLIWSMLAGILIFGGGQVAILGIRLIS